MRAVQIADLKARLSEHLREVRRGRSIVVLHRDTPVARLVPYTDTTDLVVGPPLGRFPSLDRVPLPPSPNLDFDIVDLLLEERQGER